MAGYFDFGDIDDAAFQAFVKRVGGKVNAKTMLTKVRTRTKRVGFYVVKGAKLRSPVDTGTLRRNWQIGDVAYNSAYISVTVSNNTEYASFVENGHRTRGGKGWVEGKFMLKGATDEADAKMAEFFDQEIQEYLEGLFSD